MTNQLHSSSSLTLLHNESFYQCLARLLIIFEDINMLYFDFPNPIVVDTNKRNTVVTCMIRQKETIVARDISFMSGGPLRVFLSMLLQIMRKMKPCSEEVRRAETISSSSSEGEIQMQEDNGEDKIEESKRE